MPATNITQNGPASAGSPFAVLANARIDKDRGLVLRKFPEYELDATQLIYSDTYVQYDNLMVQTLNGDYINLGNYVKKVEFNDYYPSILTEKEFKEKIASYYTKKESNELFQNIKDNYVTNVSFNNYIEQQKEKDNKINKRIDTNLDKIDNINNNVIPTLKTIESFNSDIAKYTNTEDLNAILATYTNTSAMDVKLQEIRDTHNAYKKSNDARSLVIETTIADMYDKTYINEKFALYYTKKENDVRYATLDRKIKANADELVNVNNNINIIYRDKVDNSSFTEFKQDSYRRGEIDKKIEAVNAYTKPEMNNIIDTVSTNITNTNARINDTNTRITNMYTNTFHDTRYNNLDYRVKTNFNSIEDIKVHYVMLSNYNNEIKRINDALDIRHTKTEINNIIYNNNLNYYTKREIDSKNNDDIVSYDKLNKKYILGQITENNKLYLSLSDFNTYKDTILNKNEISSLFVNKLADYDLSTVVDVKVNNVYTNTKNEYTNFISDKLSHHYEKTYIDNEFAKYRTREDDNSYINEKLKSYVTEERFVDDLSNVPSLQTMTDTIYSKLDENNKKLDETIGNHIDKKMLVFYDYLLNNSGIYYTKQIMDLKMQGKEDKSISILRYTHLENRIEKFYKKFITYYTKDEIDSKFSYYFSNVNIADATLYYTSVETDRLLADKVDKTTYDLFYKNTYNKTYVDTELNKKVNIVTYNSEISDLHENDNKLKTALDDLRTMINGDLTNSINSRFTSVESSLNAKITTNKESIDTLNTKVSDLTELSKTFKNEEQVNKLITAITDTKVSQSEYNLDKLTFTKVSDFTLLKNNLENNYTTTTNLNQSLSGIRQDIPTDIKINSMIDDKLESYTSSTDLLKLVDNKISSNSNTLKNKITEETDKKFTKYPTLTFLSQNNYTKDEADTKRNTLKQELTTEINTTQRDLTSYKSLVNDTYLKLSGGTITGDLAVNNTFNAGKYYLNNNGLKIVSESTDYMLLDVEDIVTAGINKQKGILLGSNNIGYVRFTSISDLYHNKYNADTSTYDIYKVITEETFNPYKDTIYNKTEMNNLLDGKTDKSLFDSTVTNLKSTLSTKQELNDYKLEVQSNLEHYHTIQDYQKYLSDNYVNNVVFTAFKQDTNDKINNDLKAKLDELKQDTKAKLNKLNEDISQNVNTVNTTIAGKIKTLEDNTYKKSETDSKLSLKADKSEITDVLRYNNSTQYDKTLNIGSINIKTDNTSNDMYMSINKNGILINNKTSNVTREVLKGELTSGNKYNINIGGEGIDTISITAKDLILVDKSKNVTSSIATEKMLNDTKTSLESSMTSKSLELQGDITSLETKVKTNTDNITEVFKELAKKGNNDDINTKLSKKLDKAGGTVTGQIDFNENGKLVVKNGELKLKYYYNNYWNNVSGLYHTREIEVPVVRGGLVRPEDNDNAGSIYDSNSLFLFGEYILYSDPKNTGRIYYLIKQPDKITSEDFENNPETFSQKAELPEKIYLPTFNIMVPKKNGTFEENIEDSRYPGKKFYKYEFEQLTTETDLAFLKSQLESKMYETKTEVTKSSTTANTDLETKLKKYVDDKINEKLDEIGKILDKINGA